MMKKIIPVMLLVTLLAGCGSAVRHTTSDRFSQIGPYTVAVLPVSWDAPGPDDKDVRYLMRTMTLEKLRSMDYRVIAPEEIDDKFLKLGSAAFKGKSPKELAPLFNADSILYIRVVQWETDRFVTYAALKVKVVFELYSVDGTRLWNAESSVKDADLRLDSKSMEYAIIKVYEPKVQRFVDMVFSTLPKAEPPRETKTYFQWLP